MQLCPASRDQKEDDLNAGVEESDGPQQYEQANVLSTCHPLLSAPVLKILIH